MAEYKEITNYWHNNTEYWDAVFKDIDFSILLGEKTTSINWKDLQYIGGFDLPDSINFNYINPESVFLRLKNFFNNNIIAVSELKKSIDQKLKPNKSLDIKGLFNIIDYSTEQLSSDTKQQSSDTVIYGCNTDTGFITRSNVSKNDSATFKDNDLFRYNNLNILSIHFSSGGPNGLYPLKLVDENLILDKSLDKSKEISLNVKQFIQYEFKIKENPQIQEKNKKSVNVICGDTNITESKSNLSRDELGKQIAGGLNAFFETPTTEWLVLMSSHKIIKNRRGFILRNQQLLKSIPATQLDIDGEADGTILAIKIVTVTENKRIIIERWKAYFKDIPVAQNYVIYSHDSVNPINEMEGTNDNAFNFITAPGDSMDILSNIPKEKIFLDHSVLYTGLFFLQTHIDTDIKTSFTDVTNSNKLIVLNLNSMVNKNSSWNLNVNKYITDIKNYDKALYKIMRNQIYKITDKKYIPYTIEYDDFGGDKELYYKVLSKDEYTTLNGAVKAAFVELNTELLTATKYLKKGYYEKYIKYKTKYLNLKNT
jgi:hypothetical protein